MAPRTPTSQTRRGRKARNIVSTGVSRDDSDDELGTDDFPWEFIHQDDNLTDSPEPLGSKRKRLSGNKIVAARMGNFHCALGETVLLKAEGSNEAWVAIICDFLEDDEGEKAANFMWFSTEKEIRNKDRKRSDSMPVSIRAPQLARQPLSGRLTLFGCISE